MIGKILGKRYQLIEKIASGGMSNVYKALDLNLKRYDAVKILKDEFAEKPDLVAKFKNEANAVANLNHPNIVNIYNVGQEEGYNYIVMEYVKGITLKELIKERGRLSEEQVVSITEQVAKALSHAHINNVIHRDIKPHNILITDDGRVKVLDFGIAKMSSQGTITNSGKIVGSVHYFSPEQARGYTTDRRSDVYSLGIVMYEMVTGRLPFDSESPVTIALKHMQEPISQPKLINPQISERLNQIILKATMKDPSDRYQTMDEMLTDIQKLKENKNLEYAGATGAVVAPLVGAQRVMQEVKADNNVGANRTIKNNRYYQEQNRNDDDFNDDFDLEEKKENNKNKVLLILLLVLLLALIAILYFVSKNFIPMINKTGTTQIQTSVVKVPKIVGLSQDEASLLLKNTGNLRLNVKASRDSDQPTGTILESDPAEGKEVTSGSTVNVVISGKKEMIKIPDVSRKTLDQAKKILADAGLTVGEVTQTPSDTIEVGYVIKTTPEQNSSIEKGTKVNIAVSKGKEVAKTTVPDLKGKTLDEAKKLLADAKLALGETVLKTVTDKEDDSKVLSQEQEAGSSVEEGTKINITAGKLQSNEPAPDPSKPDPNKPSPSTRADGLVTIPNIKGMTYKKAKATLAAVGLKIAVLHDYGTVPLNDRIVVEYNAFPLAKGAAVQVNLTNP